jgi:hypothetical protein
LAIFTTLAKWTGWAAFDAGSVTWSALFIGCALLVVAWVVDALAVAANLVIAAVGIFVTTGFCAVSADTDAFSGTFCIIFAGFCPGALAICALLSRGACEQTAGIVGTTVYIANA